MIGRVYIADNLNISTFHSICEWLIHHHHKTSKLIIKS